jgi:hypothetical protein
MQDLVIKATLKTLNTSKIISWTMSGVSDDLISKVMKDIDVTKETLLIPAS